VFVALASCSGEDSTSRHDREPELEGGLCVDPQNACCCAQEGLFSEATPSCIINSAGGTLDDMTLELLRASGPMVLSRLGSASECTASGGWYVASTDGTTTRIELCDATCSIRRNETTELRVLFGCPAAPC
jgi:hypothetical protein